LKYLRRKKNVLPYSVEVKKKKLAIAKNIFKEKGKKQRKK